MRLSQQACSHHSLALYQPHLWSFFILILLHSIFLISSVQQLSLPTLFPVSQSPLVPNTWSPGDTCPETLVLGLAVSFAQAPEERTWTRSSDQVLHVFLNWTSAKEIINPKWEVIKGEHSSLSTTPLDIPESKSNNKSSFAGKRNNSIL